MSTLAIGTGRLTPPPTPERAERAKASAAEFGERGGITSPVLADIVAADGNPAAAKANKTVQFSTEPDSEAIPGSAPQPELASSPEPEQKVQERKALWKYGHAISILTGLIPTAALLCYAFSGEECSTTEQRLDKVIRSLLPAPALFTVFGINGKSVPMIIALGFTLAAVQCGALANLEADNISSEYLLAARVTVSAIAGYLSVKIYEVVAKRIA